MRPLHWCLKIANREKSIEFYRNELEMIPLRHEEFAEGCKATCNGPYSNKWSKTMIGYGDESSNFILELTYNYGVEKYELGNDYKGIVIESTKLFNKLSSKGKLVNNDLLILTDPDGYPVQFVKGNSNKVIRIELNVMKLEDSIKYWSGVLTMKQADKKDNHVDLVFKEGQIVLRLIEINQKIDHKTGFGRLAFSIQTESSNTGIGLNEINDRILASKGLYKFRHNKIELGTPGKQSVTVIILLSHPDNYEICFVNSEDYDILCSTDPHAGEELDRELKKEAKKKAKALKA